MTTGSGVFRYQIDGIVYEVDHWDKLPESFDHLLVWRPEYPQGVEGVGCQDDLIIYMMGQKFDAHFARGRKDNAGSNTNR